MGSVEKNVEALEGRRYIDYAGANQCVQVYSETRCARPFCECQEGWYGEVLGLPLDLCMPMSSEFKGRLLYRM